MKANRARFPLAAMCRVLGLSPSGYYGWLRRQPSARARRDAELKARILAIWIESGGIYGCPRIHAALLAGGERVGRKRVARLMAELGIEGVTRRRFKTGTTKQDASAKAAPDLVNRDFSAEGPDQLWVADITHSLMVRDQATASPSPGARVPFLEGHLVDSDRERSLDRYVALRSFHDYEPLSLPDLRAGCAVAKDLSGNEARRIGVRLDLQRIRRDSDGDRTDCEDSGNASAGLATSSMDPHGGMASPHSKSTVCAHACAAVNLPNAIPAPDPRHRPCLKEPLP